MRAVALIVRPVHGGWAVCATDGRELVRYRGIGARWRAERFLRGLAR